MGFCSNGVVVLDEGFELMRCWRCVCLGGLGYGIVFRGVYVEKSERSEWKLLSSRDGRRTFRVFEKFHEQARNPIGCDALLQ